MRFTAGLFVLTVDVDVIAVAEGAPSAVNTSLLHAVHGRRSTSKRYCTAGSSSTNLRLPIARPGVRHD